MQTKGREHTQTEGVCFADVPSTKRTYSENFVAKHEQSELNAVSIPEQIGVCHPCSVVDLRMPCPPVNHHMLLDVVLYGGGYASMWHCTNWERVDSQLP